MKESNLEKPDNQQKENSVENKNKINNINELFDGLLSIYLWEKLSKDEFNALLKKANETNPSLTEEENRKLYQYQAERFILWMEKRGDMFEDSTHLVKNAAEKIRSLFG